MFDRFDEASRTPVGAVPEGTTVRFCVTPPRRLGVAALALSICPDGGDPGCRPMTWMGTKRTEKGVLDVFSVEFIFDTAGLYWYNFIADTAEGRLILSEEGRKTVLRREGEPFCAFQQTVYQRNFVTPDWLKEGVIYQIFPDRFYRGGSIRRPDRGRTLHERWDEEPDYDNNPFKITNSDFFGGDLKGVTEKLDYLSGLGVTVIYLNPIFEAYSNHRYDTGDYGRIDPLLGDEADFSHLCQEAKKRGIRILLDGVFSHTGADSRYFNRFGNYDSVGAAESKASPYADWYEFQRFPDVYTCWWDVWSLPCVNETSPSYLDYITGERGIARKYIRLGASGWRLDVADELPDGFLDAFRKAVKEEDPDAVVLGEVWEDASNKIAYSQRRRYLLGEQLDSVMNYLFRNAVMAFVREGKASVLADTVLSVCEHYPPQVTAGLMNLLSTHDTPRVLTALAGQPADGHDRDWQHATRLSPAEREQGKRLLKVASAIQYTLPGIPSLYYGDEAGLEGYSDPFNRGTFPWGREDGELTDWFRYLGEVRKRISREDPFVLLYEGEGLLAYRRGRVTMLANVRKEGTTLCGEKIAGESVRFLFA